MKKTLLYVGLILFAGMLAGALVCGLVWMQTLYELSMSYTIFAVVFWLEMAAVVLFGMSLRRYFPAISKVWVFSSVLLSLMCCYLFPQFLTPKCSGIPTVKAGCTTTCVQVCTWWVDKDGTYTINGITHTCTVSGTDKGCCVWYGPSCTTECTYYPPTVNGYTTCSVIGNDGWCVNNGQLHMSGTDPENLTITISGTMVGQAFSCAPGYSCLKPLIEGNGNAIFHSHNGHLSSGNFSVGYKFDATAPTLSPVVTGTAGSNGWYTTTVSVATGATDATSGVATSQIRLLSGTWQDSLDILMEGTHTVEMSALDNAGNEATQQAQIMVDTVPPVQEIGITAGTKGSASYYVSDVTVTATSGDATSGVASVVYRVDGGGWQAGTTVTVSADGTHTVDFLTTDTAGLTDMDSLSFLLDQTDPQVTITPTGTFGLDGWYVTPVAVQVSAIDLTSGVTVLEYSLDGSDWTAWTDTLLLNDGVHSLQAYAEDAAGNNSLSNLVLSIDTLPPVPYVQPTGTAGIHDWYLSDVSWQAAASDATSGVASIEVSPDGGVWIVGDTAAFSTEGPHTVDFRFTDEAGNSALTHNAFSIDKTKPTVNITSPLEGAVVKQIVHITGTAADSLSGLADVEISANGGATWQSVPWAADGTWTLDWDTTDGPNGIFAILARSTDEAGNSTTQQVNVIVDNAPPSVSITPSWWIWETADAAVYEQIIPLGSISITVECGNLPDRTYDYNPNRGPFTYQWDRRCGDGQAAASGTYSVVLRACDIYDNCGSARGKVEIPFIALVPATSTPMPTLLPTQQSVWYQTPTLVPSPTPTVQPTLAFPVLPAIGGNEGGGEAQGNPQPLLPLAAAALGTSVFLAAASRREEKETLTAEIRAAQEQASKDQQAADLAERQADVAAQTIATVVVEEPAIAVSTLATLAGVVKTSLDGIWNEAVRISPADAPITIVTHNWVNGVDPIKHLAEVAKNNAFIAWYYQNVYSKKVEQEKAEAAEKEAANDARRYAAESVRYQGLADTYFRQQAADERVEQAAKMQAYYASQIAAQQAKQKTTVESKLTRMEEATEGKNVTTPNPTPITQTSPPMPGIAASIAGVNYSGKSVFTPDPKLQEVIDTNIAKQVEGKPTVKDLFVNFLNSASAFAGKVYEAARTPTEIRNYQENYGPVSPTFGGAPGSIDISSDGNPFGGYKIKMVQGDYNTEIPEWMLEMMLSMIPFVGDGVGIMRQLINKYTTGEMDELDFTLSLIGLGMDLPFDAGIVGDTAVAVLKGFSAMIPAGPAREVLLDAVKLLFDNPEGISAMAGAVWKMMGSEDLVKLLSNNPKLLKAAIESSEHAEELLGMGPDAARLVEEIGEDGVKAMLDGGDEALEGVDDFIGILHGEKVTLPNVSGQTIQFIKVSPEEVLDLRKTFNTTERKEFLEFLSKDENIMQDLRKAGLSDVDILKIENGKVPTGYEVHHKIPLDGGGTNDFDNLILIKKDPYHKVLTNTQRTLTSGLDVGDTIALDSWPIPEGYIYTGN